MSYILRLDDACERRDIEKWNRMEELLDKYGIKPLVGVIPHCEDKMMDIYPYDENFWERAQKWIEKGWVIALHGFNHVYISADGGINPVNKRSEFAGIPLEIQKQKITDGIRALKSHGITPKVFFAPAHTFDENTLTALKECSDIRIISDTVANEIYSRDGFTFVPQQSGQVRRLPFKLVTFCYHPNVMSDSAFVQLERFIVRYRGKFTIFPIDGCAGKSCSIFDKILKNCYFLLQRLRK